METETVACRGCSTDYSITESILCSCGERVYTTRELKGKLAEMERGIVALKTFAMTVQIELWGRERRRTATDAKGKPDRDFWQNVHGRPSWATSGQAKKRKVEAKLSEREMAEFE